MANPYPANQPGVSSAPITREQIAGNPTSIANGAAANLPWNVVSSGDALLDLTTPTAPVVVASGTYAVSVQVNAEAALTAGGSFGASLTLDHDGEFASMGGLASYIGSDPPYLSLSLTYYIPAGGTIVVRVNNGDGVNAVIFDLFAIVQRLS